MKAKHARSVSSKRSAFAKLVLVLSMLCSAHTSEATEKLHSFVAGSDGKYLYDFKFMKMVNQKVTNFDNLQIVVSSCNSGGFADEADTHLAGKVSVAVSRDKKHTEPYQYRSNSNSAPWKGRGGPGLQGMPGYEHQYYFGWGPQWIKKMRDDANATAAQIFTAAKQNDFDKDEARNSSRHVVKNGGDGVKVKLANDKNEALIWSNYSSDVGAFFQLYRGLRDGGYTDGTVENARIDMAYTLFDASNLGSTDAGPVYSDRKAEAAVMKDMLDGLASRLDNTKKGFIYIAAHGNVGAFKEEHAVSTSLGRFLTPGDATVVLSVPSELLEDFFEGVSTDEPAISRELPAAVTLATSEETFSGLVTVSIDGLVVGSFGMLGSLTGGEYVLPIPDSVMQGLYTSDALGSDDSAAITFTFPAGTPSMLGFRMLTQSELESDSSNVRDFYGVALVGPSLSGQATGPVPAMSTAGALLLALALVTLGVTIFAMRAARPPI